MKEFLHLIAMFVCVIDPKTRKLTFQEPLNVMSNLLSCTPVYVSANCPWWVLQLKLAEQRRTNSHTRRCRHPQTAVQSFCSFTKPVRTCAFSSWTTR